MFLLILNFNRFSIALAAKLAKQGTSIITKVGVLVLTRALLSSLFAPMRVGGGYPNIISFKNSKNEGSASNQNKV